MAINYYRHLKTPIREKPSAWHRHHFYTGLLVAAVGFVPLFYCWYVVSGLAVAFGIWLMVDDWLQHKTQMLEWELFGEYTVVSFWHWVIEQYRGEEYDA